MIIIIIIIITASLQNIQMFICYLNYEPAVNDVNDRDTLLPCTFSTIITTYYFQEKCFCTNKT